MTHKITTFIITETTKSKKGKELPSLPPIRSAPHYFEKSVPSQFILGEKEIQMDSNKVKLTAKTYHPDAILIEAVTEVPDIFESDILELKDKMHVACYEYAKSFGGREHPAEEYAIYEISGYEGDPEKLFIEKNQEKISELLKSEKLKLHQKEIDYSLSFQFHYSKDDLLIVDWDGAVLFDPKGKTDDVVELLELANYQLLRYRVLDNALDQRLMTITKLIENKTEKKFGIFLSSREIENEFKEIIKIRSKSINEFQTIEREIKLIGDWYSARVYGLLTKKFRLDGWRETIKDKLESIEEAYTIASENLGMSKTQRLELLQIRAFFVLQVGWLILIVLEFIQLME